ncbi:prevent-host-death family antitoxin [Lactobacillus johnsonii]|mgnify:CR=1 FL=1|nr:prevent-host-death family antitoxin [Lactobacillus johnsonii]
MELKKILVDKENSTQYAIIYDQLIQMHKLSEDPIVESNDNYWNQFK